jgi:hypothetical protein
MNLKTSRAETAELLRKDAGLLTDLLRSAGYRPESVTVQAGGADAAPRAAPALNLAGGGAQDGATPDQPGRRASADAPAPQRRDSQDENAAPRDAAGRSGVYL